MRIISGKYKGLKIKTPTGIRPTLELIRKALFSILQDMIEDASFLELFCGSGIVGIEALSLGAKDAVFVDNSLISIKATKENLAHITKIQDCPVYLMDVSKFLDYISGKGRKFDIIFLDPPYFKAPRPNTCRDSGSNIDYRQSLIKKTLISSGLCDILAPNGVIVCQHSKKDVLPIRTSFLVQFKQKKYGDTLLTFYKHNEESSLPRDI